MLSKSLKPAMAPLPTAHHQPQTQSHSQPCMKVVNLVDEEESSARSVVDGVVDGQVINGRSAAEIIKPAAQAPTISTHPNGVVKAKPVSDTAAGSTKKGTKVKPVKGRKVSAKVTKPGNLKANHAQKRRTERERQNRKEKVFSGGPWTREEHLNFLRGLRKHGSGKWAEIQLIVKTRSSIQVKSHGQKVLKRMKNGENIFIELEDSELQNIDGDKSPALGGSQSPRPKAVTTEDNSSGDETMTDASDGSHGNGQQTLEDQPAPAEPRKQESPAKKSLPFTNQKPISIGEAHVVLALVVLAVPLEKDAPSR